MFQSSSSHPQTVKINESIISLLLKLHSQLSGIPDSYVPEEQEQSMSDDSEPESVIGDGSFFVAKLLRKISAVDTTCRESVNDIRKKLWPPQQDSEREQKQKENREREERRRRAKERQQRLMDEFASKQRAFLETMETDEAGVSGMDWSNEEESVLASKQEYDCVICNQTTPSTEDKPMGLVVLVQASSVLGHRRRFGQTERATLPTSEEEKYNLRRDDIQSSEFDKRVEEFDRHFDRYTHVRMFY